MVVDTAMSKSSILWSLPALSLLLGYIALWLPWAMGEIQPLQPVPEQNSQVVVTFEGPIFAHQLADLRTAVWSSVSQERLFQIVDVVANRAWYLLLPALFSFYYLFLYKLRRKSIGCLAAVLLIGIIWVIVDLPQVILTLLSIELSNIAGFPLVRITDITYFTPTLILLAIAFLLGLWSVFLCFRTGLHKE